MLGARQAALRVARLVVIRQPGLRSACRCLSFVPNNERGHPSIRFEMGKPMRALNDPFILVEPRLRPLAESMPALVGADHEMPKEAQEAASHFFRLEGKRFRPTIALLVATAANGAANERQARLAQILEMIHAASLLHDDVIDLAGTRRGAPAVHQVVGNKVAVLSGDFLLARATRLLAELEDVEVVELMATVIDEMVAGELMQVTATLEDLVDFDHCTAPRG